MMGSRIQARIQARIEQLKAGREEHVRIASLTLEQFNAAIGELEALLVPADAAPDEAAHDQERNARPWQT
jgi:hypothetical protein